MIRTALLVLAAAALALEASAQAPAPVLARTKDGHPDLHGIWESRWRTPLERPPQAPALILTAEQAATLTAGMEAGRRAAPGNGNPDSDFDLISLALVKGEYRSSLIVDPPDGRLPLTGEGRTRLARIQRQPVAADNPEDRIASERCVGGPGRVADAQRSDQQLSQDHPVARSRRPAHEAIDDVRILPLGGKHGPDAMLDLQGDSIAWWEADTLIVETTNFRADDEARVSPPASIVVLSPATIVTERFTRVSDKEIVYAYTVSDPVLYTRPWTAETSFIRTDARMFEYACHEANYSLTNILRGGREIERRAKAKP